ncbi:cold shock domain-containing protein [Candidatus Woesearchaeota archaeon]|nr:cold shock domain-containing protein [Candidatus Woesearchaeota archaeon]MBT4368037.1 cold shock domain-containing protein [Candidatus Woesearchaeota archaeon]MBT4712525.1 cold shock domain-containing protein [Candidatus Woesearchaeota archaeon]MBT6639438.1 cold shock domain-containing protein [Candidatus Woesearchaeota archaeon]MBT7133610.1 cold shock domain-containing protein [Candidatus Woesearchaeota archaeon]
MKGTVKFFDGTRGFGFIAGEDGKEYFVHQTALGEGVTLNENEAVTFEVEEGDRGPKAVNVARGGEDSAPAEEASEDVAEDAAEEPAEEASEEVAEDAAEEPAEEEAEEEAPAEEASEDEAEDAE